MSYEHPNGYRDPDCTCELATDPYKAPEQHAVTCPRNPVHEPPEPPEDRIEVSTLLPIEASEELRGDAIVSMGDVLAELAANPAAPPRPPETADEAIALLIEVARDLGLGRGGNSVSVPTSVRLLIDVTPDGRFFAGIMGLSELVSTLVTGKPGAMSLSGDGDSLLAAFLDLGSKVREEVLNAASSARSEAERLEDTACAMSRLR